MRTYETVIGLEVHAELNTKSKIFCACSTEFGAEPNSHCCPVCAGLPGALPVLNEAVVEKAVRAGLAAHCEIAPYSRQERKNYFYPDLPKAYQISQYALPLCRMGYLDIESRAGVKRVRLNRIHIEEDAGKLIHDARLGTLIDLNRCGVPLIEIVSEPDLRSAEEARAYLSALRAMLIEADVSDCRMNEGQFRCDVNISLRPIGETALGTRTEIKNLNSFAAVEQAIGLESARQAALLEAGQAVRQTTLRFDAEEKALTPLRDKEDADDYRYFPDPDLPPIVLREETIAAIRRSTPVAPGTRLAEQYGLGKAEAGKLAENAAHLAMFTAAAPLTAHRGHLCRVLAALPPEGAPAIRADDLAKLADLLAAGELRSGALEEVLSLPREDKRTLLEVLESHSLRTVRDPAALRALAARAIAENPLLVQTLRGGKSSAAKALMGAAMRLAGGRADPEALQKQLEAALGSL